MTDNEIIKALECHIKRRCWDDCPNANEERQSLNKPCSQMIAEDALTLINRQKAEIERLEAENEEQHQAIINALHRMGEIRAEAVKEFAERVKEKIRTMSRIVVYDEDIDNLVKEFTEEQK